ncbi:MAG: NAD(P)-dependent oxidoreductase [Rickettsiales bacterium]|nr:NAD(P)-dependent oxidoreductase [Rickettsiales bacterium]
MLPIILKPDYVSALVIGDGVATYRRLEMLEKAGVSKVKHLKNPSLEDVSNALDAINIVYVADFDDEFSEKIAKIIRARNIILNIEDKGKFCDFNVPAIIRAGDMLITASTAGTAPRIARRAKKILEKQFDNEFAEKMSKVSNHRLTLKSKGASMEVLIEESDKIIDEVGLFDKFCDRCKS